MNKPFYFRFISNSHKALLSGVAVMALVIAAGVSDNHVSVANAAPTQSVERLANGAPMSFADVIDVVRPSVVNISVKLKLAEPVGFEGNQPRNRQDMQEFFDSLPDGHPFKRFFEDNPRPRQRGQGEQRPQAMSQGSGFVISTDGYVVTNNHVVEDADEVEVTFYDGKVYAASVIGTDPLTDLALLKIESQETFQPVAFATEKPRVGDWVVAMGNPFGLGGTVTAGIVSANGRDINAGPYDDFLQIDAAVNKGNSGGPTFNLQGEVVGVNSMIFSPSGGNVGIAFAIPADLTSRIVADLQDDGEVSRGWLGVALQPLDEALKEGLGVADTSGALINKVENDSPASKAGLKVGDVVTSVNGTAITTPKDLARAIGTLPAGDTAKVSIMRQGKKAELKVELGDRTKLEKLRRS